MERVNGITDVVAQMRQMASSATASSPVDAPPSDPDVWPLPKRCSATPRLKNTSRKQTASRVTDTKAKKTAAGKSSSQNTIGRNSGKRANSLGRASLGDPSETALKEESDSNGNVSLQSVLFHRRFHQIICFVYTGLHFFFSPSRMGVQEI